MYRPTQNLFYPSSNDLIALSFPLFSESFLNVPEFVTHLDNKKAALENLEIDTFDRFDEEAPEQPSEKRAFEAIGNLEKLDYLGISSSLLTSRSFMWFIDLVLMRGRPNETLRELHLINVDLMSNNQGIKLVNALRFNRSLKILESGNNSAAKLPEGWKYIVGHNMGRSYYYNSIRMMTSWERPIEYAEVSPLFVFRMHQLAASSISSLEKLSFSNVIMPKNLIVPLLLIRSKANDSVWHLKNIDIMANEFNSLVFKNVFRFFERLSRRNIDGAISMKFGKSTMGYYSGSAEFIQEILSPHSVII